MHTRLHLPVPRAPASPRAPPRTPLCPQTEGRLLYVHKSHVATHPVPRAQQRDPRWSPHNPIFRHTRTNTTRPAAENGSAKGCSAPGTNRRQARALAQTLKTLNRRCPRSPVRCLSAQRCFTNPYTHPGGDAHRHTHLAFSPLALLPRSSARQEHLPLPHLQVLLQAQPRDDGPRAQHRQGSICALGTSLAHRWGSGRCRTGAVRAQGPGRHGGYLFG